MNASFDAKAAMPCFGPARAPFMALFTAACAAAVLLASSGFLAGPALAADPVYPIGSRVGLVPPGKMTPSRTVRGFEDRDAQAAILVLEMPQQAYPEIEKGLNPEAFQKQGLTEEKREPVTLASGNGVLIVGHQESDGRKARKWILLASVADLTALIAVQVPDAAVAAYPDAEMHRALTSLAVRASVPVDEQLKLLPFVFDELSGLRPFRVVAPAGAFLTLGSKDTADATEQPLLAVSIGQGGPEQTPDRDNFARNLLSGLGDVKNVRIVGRDFYKIGTIPTHEIQAEALDPKTDTPMKLVQWIRFGNGAFVRVVGLARADKWSDAFPRFRAVRDGIRPAQ